MPVANVSQQLTLEEIVSYVRGHIGQWLAEESLSKPPVTHEVELRERMIRIEDELGHQRDLMKQGFGLMEKRMEAMSEETNKRFDAIMRESDKRFEMVDKRFEDMNGRFGMIDKRFEDMNKRFEMIDKRFEMIDKRFEDMNKRFEMIDKRFEDMNKRFEDANKRFEEVNRRVDMLTQRIDRFIIWSLGATMGSASLVITVLKFL